MNDKRLNTLRRQLAEACHFFDVKGLVDGAAGNLSARIDTRHVLATPTLTATRV